MRHPKDMALRNSTHSDHIARITRALHFIQAHLDREITPEELARLACYSEFHFHRIFRGMVGESLIGHVRRLRLERAAFRLKMGKDKVLSLALEAGYDSHESFTRAFTQQFGLSPSAFRKHHKQWALVEAPGVHYQVGQEQNFEFLPMKGSPMEVRILKPRPMRVAYIRHIGPYEACFSVWEKLCAWAGPLGLLGPETGFFGVCYSDPEVTAPQKIQLDVCLSIPDHILPEAPISVQTLFEESRDYAVTLHQGPYRHFHQTYAKLCGQWLPEHKREPVGAYSIEHYLNDPGKVTEEDLKTDVYVPVR